MARKGIAMIKVKTFRNHVECDQAKCLLDSSGIVCTIKNEYGASTAGAGLGQPLPFAQPELWIIDDSKKDEALAVLNQEKKKSKKISQQGRSG